MTVLHVSCLYATQHPCTSRMRTEPHAIPRALFDCPKFAVAQRGHIARQLSGTCYVRKASCTRKYQVGAVSCCMADQHSGPDISLLHPRLQRQWDHEENAHLGNIQITPQCGRRVCWVCNECPLRLPHKWTARVSNRTDGTQCPFCDGKKPCQHNCLATQAPTIAAEFSNKKEGTPHDYTVNSGKKLHWQCVLGHEWLAAISQRTSQKQSCPTCYAQQQRGRPKMRHPVLTESKHPMVQHWDWEANVKAGLDPSQITCRSSKRAHWICLYCPTGRPHKWQASVGNMYNGHGCPCCSGHKACTCNSIQSLFPDVAAEWDYSKNKGTPVNYTASSNKIVWWHNDQRGSFQASIQHRTYVRKAKLGN